MPRSRNGCTTCKRRHRKCDETKPECLECKKNKLRCEGYAIKLQWDIGVASRGRLTGATVPVLGATRNETRPREQDRPEMNGSFGQFQAIAPSADTYSQGVDAPDSPLDAASCSMTDADPQEPEWLRRRSDGEKELFRQFVQRTVFLLYSTSTHDSYWTELKQLALQTEPLFLILIATHLYITNPRNPSPLFRDLCNQSLRLFREQLNRFDGTLDAGLINAGIFLCTLHLFQGIPWTSQLKHMMWVYGFFPGAENASRIADVEYRFPIETMAVMDLQTFVRGRDTPTLSIWTCLRSAQASKPTGLIDGVESVTGLPRSLLDLFARLGDASAEQAFVGWPGYEGSVPHCHLWEAFRLSGILLTRRQLRISGPQSPTNEVLVCRLIASLDALYETRHRPEYGHILARNSILYPYTAARLEVSILRSRPSWVEALRRYQDHCEPYRETPVALILEEILDKALEAGDNDIDLDKEARKRGVELSLF
ncbi:hypothetical protein F66182_947 [Fusarium sp. NRRL 66182]|nr:hypothetical protein F66182_947 [Fusarium sp. NRRL 66182]